MPLATVPLSEKALAIIATALANYSDTCASIATTSERAHDGLADEWRKTARQARCIRDLIESADTITLGGVR